jgi:hypothetical protein
MRYEDLDSDDGVGQHGMVHDEAEEVGVARARMFARTTIDARFVTWAVTVCCRAITATLFTTSGASSRRLISRTAKTSISLAPSALQAGGRG